MLSLRLRQLHRRDHQEDQERGPRVPHRLASLAVQCVAEPVLGDPAQPQHPLLNQCARGRDRERAHARLRLLHGQFQVCRRSIGYGSTAE